MRNLNKRAFIKILYTYWFDPKYTFDEKEIIYSKCHAIVKTIVSEDELSLWENNFGFDLVRLSQIADEYYNFYYKQFNINIYDDSLRYINLSEQFLKPYLDKDIFHTDDEKNEPTNHTSISACKSSLDNPVFVFLLSQI